MASVRVISAVAKNAAYWRSEARRLSRHYRGIRPDRFVGSAAWQARQAAATAELLGVPVSVGAREVRR